MRQPLRWMWEHFFSTAPRIGLWVVRWLYFWALVARSYLVRRGAIGRARPGRAPLPTSPAVPAAPAPAVRPARMPAAAAGHA